MLCIHWSDLHIGKNKDKEVDATYELVTYVLRHFEPAHTVILITGDVVETPADGLYVKAHDLLKPLHSAGFLLCGVPGNHDVHPKGLDVGPWRAASYSGWINYLAPILGAHTRAQWPQRWSVDGWHLIGLDTNHSTAQDWRVGFARGGVGQDQLADLTLLLQDTPSIVFGHHRVWWEDSAHRLEDARDLHKILDPRAAYYLCGHQHRAYQRIHGGVEYIAAPRTTQRSPKGILSFQVLDLDTRTVRWVNVDPPHQTVV